MVRLLQATRSCRCLPHLCLISRELKIASSGAYSPGAPIQLPPHDVPCADKNSSVLIPFQDYPPPFPIRIHRLQRQQRKKFSALPLLYPLRKSSLRSHANKNSLSLIIGRLSDPVVKFHYLFFMREEARILKGLGP